MTEVASLGVSSFQSIRDLFFSESGIWLKDSKRLLVQQRLRPRLEALALPSFDAYCRRLVEGDSQEKRLVVDLLTTHETYFFREPNHFNELAMEVRERFKDRPIRGWSAACASGEEPYSIAMTLLDVRPCGDWVVCGTDIAHCSLQKAEMGIYPLTRVDAFPPDYLRRFAQRGTGEFDGSFRVKEEVRRKVQYSFHNLLSSPMNAHSYDVVFVRNVLIYFDKVRMDKVLDNLLHALRPGGLIFFGHGDCLGEHELPIRKVHRSVYEYTGDC